jgi:hypothetical protein
MISDIDIKWRNELGLEEAPGIGLFAISTPFDDVTAREQCQQMSV